jgi:hypothetical protein|eukprot:COSAG01_NODE_3534_length_5961_cov_1047.081372_6_plen_279_part_00
MGSCTTALALLRPASLPLQQRHTGRRGIGREWRLWTPRLLPGGWGRVPLHRTVHGAGVLRLQLRRGAVRPARQLHSRRGVPLRAGLGGPALQPAHQPVHQALQHARGRQQLAPRQHGRWHTLRRPEPGLGPAGCGVRCALQPVVLTGISLCDVCSCHEILRAQRTRVGPYSPLGEGVSDLLTPRAAGPADGLLLPLACTRAVAGLAGWLTMRTVCSSASGTASQATQGTLCPTPRSAAAAAAQLLVAGCLVGAPSSPTPRTRTRCRATTHSPAKAQPA